MSAPLRSAVYARYSSDRQSAESIADQVTHCREFAAANGLEIIEHLITEDAGISGASRHNRPALVKLIERIDEWDVLLCWEFSRIARNSEDLGWVRNRLRVARFQMVPMSLAIRNRCTLSMSFGRTIRSRSGNPISFLSQSLGTICYSLSKKRLTLVSALSLAFPWLR